MDTLWYAQSISDVIQELNSSERGLSNEEFQLRLQKFGYNKLPEEKVDSMFIIFLRQFQSPLIYILVSASIAVFLMSEIADGLIILIILLFNAIVGTVQEGRAQNALLVLKKFVETKTTVLREEKEIIIPDIEVVPGDIIIFQEGEKIPADARIIESNNLKVDEAVLTGESEPVHKISGSLTGKLLQVSDQKNMVFKATNVVAGDGRAVVIATGQKTVIGEIAIAIKGLDTEIPLKTNIKQLSKMIIISVLIIISLIFMIGVSSGKPAKEMFLIIISLAVSVVPEGLPVVVTLVLAMGVWRMSKQSVLIKKLQAVEALGQAQIIAVDKTGTITRNELVVKKIYVNGKMFNILGDGYEPIGKVCYDGHVIDAVNYPEILYAAKLAAYGSNARIMYVEEEKRWRIAGDPTEASMLVFAEKIGFHKKELEREFPIIAEIPFDYKLRYHAVMCKDNNERKIIVIGAPETIIKMSSRSWRDDRKYSLTVEEKNKLESVLVDMSRNGLRVIAFAETQSAPDDLKPEAVKDLVFGGFYGIRDSLRPEVAEAMQKAASAGIRVIMVTGDHKVTAQAIAREVGIYHDGDDVITGEEIDSLSAGELKKRLNKASVFARVNPDHKIAIIRAFRSQGRIVAMTGDGVNDAPSLIAADLGVAMGGIGTEVAKEAADIVLLNDNFGNIISAVEEGRSIYKTITKVVLYLFSTSLGEIMTIVGALFLGFPLPILAAQIIWLNFVTDGFLDVSLAMEPKEEGLLQSNYTRNKYLIDWAMTKRMIIMALPMAIGTLLLFKMNYGSDIIKAWTISLTTLAVFQWFNAWNCRSEDKSIFQMSPFSNKFLLSSTTMIAVFQFFAVYNPLMQKFLHTTALSLDDWLMIVPVAASVMIIEEIRKYIHRKRFSA